MAADSGTALRVRAERGSGVLIAAALCLYAVALLRTAWLSDDSYIAFRAIDNLKHGYGLLSNPPERVMGFTNPLWTLIVFLPVALGLGMYAAAMGLSLVCSAGAAMVISRVAASPALAALAISWLAVSGAYLDFSTSGLENPLTHVLLAVLFGHVVRATRRGASVVPFCAAGLLVLNRLDHALLALPALVQEIVYAGPGRFRTRFLRPSFGWTRAALAVAAPSAAWMLFATVYYGFPYPNTAYAKLNTTIPASRLAAQGVRYLFESLQKDPATVFVMGLALVTAMRVRSRSAFAAAAGILLYLAYVVRVGGDFMTGRFLTTPFIVAVIWLAGEGLANASPASRLGLAAATLVFALPRANALMHDEKPERWDISGIANERLWYARYSGLFENLRESRIEQEVHWRRGAGYRRKGRVVVTEASVGFLGYAAGPKVHVIDSLALTDPLLSRISYSPSGGFRIGHFGRTVPIGYSQTIATGRNLLLDPCLHRFYDVLLPVIRGPLFTRERWRAILALNLGHGEPFVNGRCAY